MTRMTATAEVSAIGQIVLNSSNRLLASSFNMLTVAKFVRTSVATAADTIGGPTLREYLKRLSSPPSDGENTILLVNNLRTPARRFTVNAGPIARLFGPADGQRTSPSARPLAVPCS